MTGDRVPTLGLIALNRFAFGARGGSDDYNRAASDPRGYLLAELAQPAVAELRIGSLPTTAAALQEFYADQKAKKKEREATASVPTAPEVRGSAPDSASNKGSAGEMMSGPSSEQRPAMATPKVENDIFKDEAMARFRAVLHANVGFAERLVHFWSNHFCVSVAKGGPVRATAGAFEREAIRERDFGLARSGCRVCSLHNWSFRTVSRRRDRSPPERRRAGLSTQE
jgi:uncharacterized protein (DUF1800 family)